MFTSVWWTFTSFLFYFMYFHFCGFLQWLYALLQDSMKFLAWLSAAEGARWIFNSSHTSSKLYIALDKRMYQENIFPISPLKKQKQQQQKKNNNNMLWYSLEAPQWGASNEYPQHIFSRRNKQNINSFDWKKMSYLKVCIQPALWSTWSLRYMWTQNALISLNICAVWSVSSLPTFRIIW